MVRTIKCPDDHITSIVGSPLGDIWLVRSIHKPSNNNNKEKSTWGGCLCVCVCVMVCVCVCGFLSMSLVFSSFIGWPKSVHLESRVGGGSGTGRQPETLCVLYGSMWNNVVAR